MATLTASVKESKIACVWKVVCTEDDDDAESKREKAEKGYTLPEYAFTLECGGVTSEESAGLDVRGWIKLQLVNEDDKRTFCNMNYEICAPDGRKIYGKTDKNGYIEIKDLKFVSYSIILGDSWQ